MKSIMSSCVAAVVLAVVGAAAAADVNIEFNKSFDFSNIKTFNAKIANGRGWRGFGGGMATSNTSVSDYTERTLLVDIYDAKTKQVIRRGTAADHISDKQDKREKPVEKASEKLFKKFAPESGKK